MTAVLPDADFTLMEGGETTSGAEFLKSSKCHESIIFTQVSGVRGVVSALMSDWDAYLVRDESEIPELTESGDAGRLWLQTSGTTGKPKWVGHDRAQLVARVAQGRRSDARWLLTFHPVSFAGVQVILSAMVGGHTLVAPALGAGVADLVDLAVRTSVTHISGTPTFWRAFLMAVGSRQLDLKSATLGGEAADQAVLDALRQRFPEAALRHIYATTEAGRVFSVSDGKAGFPKAWLTGALSISDRGTLLVASPAAHGQVLDTGDRVEIVGDRVLFRGREDAMVNVGGVKVYPEAVEAHMLELSFIQDVRVTAKPNPITGQILSAEIVLKPSSGDVSDAIKTHLSALPRAFRPVSLRYVDAIAMGATGKKSRVS